MKLAWAVLAFFAARFTAIALNYPRQDADLSWQQWLGARVLQLHHIPANLGLETFTAPGARWIPQEWLFSTAVAATLPSGRFAWLAMPIVAAAVGALALTAWRAQRRGASTFATIFTTALAGFAVMQSFGVRAQVFGWLLLAAIMLLLDMESPIVFLTIPLTVLWANLHASALIVPVLVGAWAFGTAIEDRQWTPRVERNAVLTLGTALAVLLTPFTWHLPAYAIALQTSSIRQAISEWQPPDLSIAAFDFGLLPLIAMACFFGIAAPRERWRDGMLFAVTTILAFTAIRHMPLCALVIAPMVAQRLSSAIPQHARLNVVLGERFTQLLIGGASVIAAIALLVAVNRSPVVAKSALPQAPVAALAAVHGIHRLYCEDFAWCSLALSHSNLRVFLDGRCDPFPAHVWNDYLAVRSLKPTWASVLDTYGVQAVLTARGRALAQGLSLRPDWRVFYRDKTFLIFTRSESARTAAR